jgi:lipoprotein-anchoring transpeptidase ErfK/SrfK
VYRSLPQRVAVWHNGRNVFTTLANTGIAGRPTNYGIFPIYLRQTVGTMSGTNPNGSTYHDSGIRWISYFSGGDALHQFSRPGYGYPQSLGCVEMTDAGAHRVFQLTEYGTLVDTLS